MKLHCLRWGDKVTIWMLLKVFNEILWGEELCMYNEIDSVICNLLSLYTLARWHGNLIINVIVWKQMFHPRKHITLYMYVQYV